MANTTGSSLPLYETACPPGLSGTNCTQATCDSPFITATQRTARPSGQTSCQTCTNGFTGVNCNICGSAANSCQLASQAAGSSPSLTLGSLVLDGATNSTYRYTDNELVCHRQPDPVTTTYMQCDINQLTLSALFGGGQFTLTSMKVVQPDNSTLNGVPTWTGAESGSTFSQVWLDGVEQFACQATGCVGSNSTTSSTGEESTLGSAAWTCSDLQCQCLSGSKMCSAAPGAGVNLSDLINGISGGFELPCDYIDSASSSGNATCAFKNAQLQTLLGQNGVPLSNCYFSSCLAESQLQNYWSVEASKEDGAASGGSDLSGPVIGGLAVLGVLVAALLGLLLWGFLLRRKAKAAPRGLNEDEDPSIGLVWKDLSYILPVTKSGLFSSRSSHQPSQTADVQTEKAEEGLAAQQQGHTHELAAGAASTKEHRILRNVSGSAAPGSLVAVLGPSGAGKTTLVELLAGKDKQGKQIGQIRLQAATSNEVDGNDDDLLNKLSSKTGRRLFAFVDQEDQLPSHSTVREALRFAAQLSLPENVPTEEKHGIVEATIATLGLAAVADRRIGTRGRRGISGGEKRRVSIGLALVARPRILVLDEPLSGLDAFNAARVISTLRALAHGSQGATTVLLTLHQPSSDIFHKLDKAIVMENGRVFYQGSPDDALQWCAMNNRPCPPGYNVADHLLDMAFRDDLLGTPEPSGSNPEAPAMLRGVSSSTSALSNSPSSKNGSQKALEGTASSSATLSSSSNGITTTWLTQVGALTKRYCTIANRDSAGPLAHLVIHIAVGLLAGGSFFQVKKTIGGFQNRIGSLYFLYMLMLFASLSAITLLASMRSLMARERADGFYGALSWLTAHVLYDIVLLRFIPGVCLQIIMYWMVGLTPEADLFFQYLLVGQLFYIAATLYMMILAALFEDLSVAILLGGAFVLFNIGFGGFLLNLNTLPSVVRWIQWLCPMKYALEAVTVNEVDHLTIADSLDGVPFDIPATSIANSLFGLTGSYYRDLLVLALGFCLGFAIILSGTVWWRMKDRR